MFKKLLIIAALGGLLAACDPGVSTTGSNSPINIIDAGDDVHNPIQASPSDGSAPASCPVDTPVDVGCSAESAAACRCQLP